MLRRSLTLASTRSHPLRMASAAVTHHQQPQPSLLAAVKERLASQKQLAPAQLEQRFQQLKRHHMQYLAMDINWAQFKPEEREEALRDLEALVTDNFQSLSKQEQDAVPLSWPQIESVDPQRDFRQWDLVLQKNDALQAGDWKKMSLSEKQAAYYLAWGPKAEGYSEQNKAIFFRSAAFLFATAGLYFSLLKYFRSKKEVPTLSPEWRAANRDRLIQERSNPYTGEAAHLFTKDGIKSA